MVSSGEVWNKGFMLVALLLSCSLSVIASQAIDNRIVVALEEPASDSTVSGVGNLRGWAVGPDGIDHVEFYVNGVLKKEIPYGGARGDVANAYPNFPDSRYSGFSSAYAYSLLMPGTHTLKVKAVSAGGKYKEASNTFKVTRFHKGYFSDPKAMDIADSSVSQDGTGILLDNIKVEGKTYDVRLEWQVPSQQFGIVDIVDENIAGNSWTANGLQVTRSLVPAASQAIDEYILVALEEPAANSTVSGVGNLRGWTVGPDGIDHVEFYVDGVLKKEIPYGGARGDVANAYPNFPDSRYSGFSSAYAYGLLTPGTHTLKGRAVSAAGKYREASNTFKATRFHKGYFIDPKAMDIADSSVNQDGTGILLDNIKVEGQTYDVRLEWQVPSQQFGIVDIVQQKYYPSSAINPSPADNATGVVLNTYLSWKDGGGADTYDIYFGTDPSPDNSEFKGNQSAVNYNPGVLAYNTTYYWRIDAVNSEGMTTGDVWQFTTRPGLPCNDVSGYWSGTETVTFTYVSSEGSDTDTYTGDATIFMNQDKCEISYEVPGTSYIRSGTIDGNKLELSGLFMIPNPDVNFTRNVINITGNVNGDDMTLNGVGEAEGTYEGDQFRLIGVSKVTLERD